VTFEQPIGAPPLIRECPPTEPLHQAAAGYVGLTIIHEDGTCAWCDAERWRRLPPGAKEGRGEAGFRLPE
jgi:hypothetical protein